MYFTTTFLKDIDWRVNVVVKDRFIKIIFLITLKYIFQKANKEGETGSNPLFGAQATEVV